MKSIVLTLFIMPLFFTIQAQEKSNIVVLELFTSQGCSSCPPADVLLKKVKNENDNVIALSYHVDYWNYIGWKDPFSKASYSDAQRTYATKFNSSTIYTPQLVVNGKEHVVGSDRAKVTRKIKAHAQTKTSSKVAITKASKKDQQVTFDYTVNGDATNKVLRVILVIDERTTSVKRGENRNKIIVNSNVVVAEQAFELKEREASGSVIIPEIVEANDELSIVLLLQDKNLDVLSGAQMAL